MNHNKPSNIYLKKAVPFIRLIIFASFLPVIGLAQVNNQPGKASITNDAGTKSIVDKLDAYNAGHAAEKAYLHFDKPYYAAGDTIYFKAYVTLGSLHELSDASGVLNVDLINPGNSSIRSLKLQLINGVAWGDMALPDSLKQGTYHVVAYTNWMRNAGNDYYFNKAITIGGVVNTGATTKSNKAAANKAASANAVQPKFSIQFFPEGGALINGNYSKVAFKAVGLNGLGTNVKGTVVDDQGAEVTTFETAHLGMGTFNIVPETGKLYKAKITYADGSTGIEPLPKAADKGYTMYFNNTDAENIKIRITASDGNTISQLKLVAQLGGVVYYAAKNEPEGKFFTAVIPKSKFPSGIVQFTLFSATGEPLNERLVFVKNPDELKLDVSTASTAFDARQKVKINIATKDKAGKAVTGNFSVAVTDETKVPVNETDETTILSSLLLTSDLKGYIEQPNYYFINTDDKTQADLDILMLTQGYRRFEWKAVLANTSAAALYPPEKALKISGYLKKASGKVVAGSKITLFTKAGSGLVVDTLTDAEGRFVFKNLEFADSVKFVIQAKPVKGQDNVILTLDNLEPALVMTQNQVAIITADETDRLSAYVESNKQFHEEQLKNGVVKGTNMLNGVTIKAKKASPFEHSQNLNGPGNADYTLTSARLENLNCVRAIDCLFGIVPGLIMKNGVPYSNRAGGPMAVVIDGNFDDGNFFENLRTSDIESIEFLTSLSYAVIYGSRGSNGLILVTTKTGRKGITYETPWIVTYTANGYYKAREFYAPAYDNPKTNAAIPDLRSTIYWKPEVVTDAKGNAAIEYFNADSKGVYRVVVEGIDEDGNLGRLVYRYQVK